MLDGTEITQFTYFQQVGGIDLSPISCEITYGIERIAMFLQKVDNVFDLRVGRRQDTATSGCARKWSSRSTRSTRTPGSTRERYSAFHRHQFDENYEFGERAAGKAACCCRRSSTA